MEVRLLFGGFTFVLAYDLKRPAPLGFRFFNVRSDARLLHQQALVLPSLLPFPLLGVKLPLLRRITHSY